MSWKIRRLTAEDSDPYRDIRLEMLANCPDAFGDSHDANITKTKTDWQTMLIGSRAFFGAFVEGELVGTVNFLQETATKMVHRGLLLGMYVKQEMRGTGCARALVETVLVHAKGKVLQVHLGVGAHNMPAIRLYEKAGFEHYGTDPRALRVEDRFLDEHLMVKFLDRKTSNE